MEGIFSPILSIVSFSLTTPHRPPRLDLSQRNSGTGETSIPKPFLSFYFKMTFHVDQAGLYLLSAGVNRGVLILLVYAVNQTQGLCMLGEHSARCSYLQPLASQCFNDSEQHSSGSFSLSTSVALKPPNTSKTFLQTYVFPAQRLIAGNVVASVIC